MSKIKPKDFANFLLFNSKKDLSNLELQLLINLISIDYENKFYRKLLEDELTNFKSYSFKISEDVYWEFRNYGADSINKPDKEIKLNLSKRKIKFILNKLNYYNENGYFNNVSLIQKHYQEERKLEKLAETHAKTFMSAVWLCIPIFTLLALLKYIFV
ncbi:hypothetical protein [Campylobacter phage CP81]|uniref:Uncharacterized protein n=3 Tax=Fletchervirus TaxID=1636618 RepID=G8GIR7_9CAUD|nr:hypothetical protein CaPhCPX_gp005 [Campylobacter phage CPX]YP_009623398.1 hypothetical protein FDJ37_gp143 [Campylobacter phage CP81]AET34302.1 hypothetical protein [Campylobacter phage CPX]AGS81176.1 hypothetical protein [Campylobacter phage CP8]CBZ42339.1 hypothetical protein [Campylobacter phage CP81]